MNSANNDDGAGNTAGLPPAKITFKDNKKVWMKNKFINFGKFIWNNKKKRFLGRDGEDWRKFLFLFSSSGPIIAYQLLQIYNFKYM
jgi:hypothetical protein